MQVNVAGSMRVIDAILPLLEKSKSARVVNVSSELASFGGRNDSQWMYSAVDLPTYQASKAALNSLTLSYAKLLEKKRIKVNAVCPGYTATAATNFSGTRTPDQAAAVVATFALLGEDGPTGAFANEAGILPW